MSGYSHRSENNRRRKTMLTIHIPKGGQAPDLNKEMSSARNIKDKTNRQNTLDGLRTISRYI